MYSSVVLQAVAKAVRRINAGLSTSNRAEALSGLNDFLLVAEQGYGEVKLTPVFFSLLSHLLAMFSLLLDDAPALSSCSFAVDRWFWMLAQTQQAGRRRAAGAMSLSQAAVATYDAVVPPVARSAPPATPRLVESLMASATVHTHLFVKAVFRACLDGLVELVGIAPVLNVDGEQQTMPSSPGGLESSQMSPVFGTKGPKKDYPATLSKLLFAIESRIGECENSEESMLLTNIIESIIPLTVYACSKAEISIASEIEAQLIRLRNIVCAFVGHGADAPQDGGREQGRRDGQDEDRDEDVARAENRRLGAELGTAPGAGVPARCAGVLSAGCGACSLCLLGRPN